MSYAPKSKQLTFAEKVESYVNRSNAWRINNGKDAMEMRDDVLKLGEEIKADHNQWAAWMVSTMIAEYPERVVVYCPTELYRRYADQYYSDSLQKHFKKPVVFQITRYDA